MLLVKQELLAALANTLESFSPGAGAKAAFESPKVAAHGDFASTAAMQLAKPLQRKPRELAEELSAALHGHAGLHPMGRRDRDRRPRLPQHPPEDRRQAAGGARGAGRGRGLRPPAGRASERVLVEFVSANPTGPLHVGHGRQAALGDAICNLLATQGDSVWREFYYNDAGVQIQTLATSTQLRAKGFKPGDAEWPEQAYNGDYIADIAAGLQGEEDRAAPTTASTPPAATSTTSTRSASSPSPTCATSRTWT